MQWSRQLGSKQPLYAIFVSIILAIASVGLSEAQNSTYKLAVPCNAQKCQLPDCRCSGLTLPKSEFAGKEKQIPQLVTVTFDDAVNFINFEQYQQLLEGLNNPDKCTAQATFYISHEYTDYVKVNALYNQGHEIALHSVSHGTGADYWRKANISLLLNEFGTQLEMLEKFAKVKRKDVKGMRMPYLQLAGNNSYIAAQQLGLTYDSSWPTQSYRDPAMWPYTLDYLTVQDCPIGPCPNAALPGFWVYPMVMWLDKEDYSCSMIDACIYQPEDDVDAIFAWLQENFQRHYAGNRAPFGMYMHAAWFARAENSFAALRKFLQHLTTLPDVYITTPSRVIEYMRNPVLGKPFESCLKKPKTKCRKRSCNVRKVSTGETRYITVCDECPSVYPWLNNALGKL